MAAASSSPWERKTTSSSTAAATSRSTVQPSGSGGHAPVAPPPPTVRISSTSSIPPTSPAAQPSSRYALRKMVLARVGGVAFPSIHPSTQLSKYCSTTIHPGFTAAPARPCCSLACCWAWRPTWYVCMRLSASLQLSRFQNDPPRIHIVIASHCMSL